MKKLSEAGEIRAKLTMMDIQILQKYACELKKHCYTEIGTGWGGSAFFVRIATPQKIYSIDISPFCFQHWKINPEEFDIYAIVNDSKEEAKKWNEQIGMLLIDGNHKEAKKDFDAWEKFVVKGGIILFHDYCKMFPRVIEDCDEILIKNKDRYKLLFKPPSMWKRAKTSMFVLQKL